MQKSKVFVLLCAFMLSNIAQADLVVYPAKGQSPEQQKKDESACYSWAVNQSGFDPAKPPPVPAASAPPAQPSGPSGARVRGAMKGAIIGEIADGDTGDAAVAGAVLGGSKDRRQRRHAEQQQQANTAQQQQAALAKQQASMDAFNKARAACLEGRGYSVK